MPEFRQSGAWMDLPTSEVIAGIPDYGNTVVIKI